MRADGSVIKSEMRTRLVRDLLINGAVNSTSGQATRKLHRRMKLSSNERTFVSFLTHAEKDGIIGRKMNGRRTEKIWLKHNPWPELEDKELEVLTNGTKPQPLPPPQLNVPDTVPALPEQEFPVMEIALKLFEIAVQKASAPSKVPELEERLATTNRNLRDEIAAKEEQRHKLLAAQDEVHALKQESANLRKQIITLQDQLDRVTKSSQQSSRIALNEGANALLKDLMKPAQGTH